MANERRARESTKTSAFGVSRREGHDASAFYRRFRAPELSRELAGPARRDLDEIFVGDAREMDKVDDGSVALVVTSPPYFAGKEYETALGEGHVPSSYLDYLSMLEAVFAQCVRKLEPGGRIAVNVANLGRRPFRSLSSDVTAILQDRLGLLLRGEIVWLKARGATGSCAWGSFQSPVNPVLRDLSERVVVASKGRFDRAPGTLDRARAGLPSQSSITRDEFMEATLDVWEIDPESANRVGHPAPFPVALPERLIQLYTYTGDLVLDPFMGSGSTAVAAVRTGRHYVGYDTDAGYAEKATERALAARVASASAGTDRLAVFEDRTGAAGAPGSLGSARDLAATVIERCGFATIAAKVALGDGLVGDFTARDRAGRPFVFEVCGGFTSSRPGLQRSERLWRALGKASVLHARSPEVSLVLLTSALPDPRSAAAKALRRVTGELGPVRDVVVLDAPEDLERLSMLARGAG